MRLVLLRLTSTLRRHWKLGQHETNATVSHRHLDVGLFERAGNDVRERVSAARPKDASRPAAFATVTAVAFFLGVAKHRLAVHQDHDLDRVLDMVDRSLAY